MNFTLGPVDLRTHSANNWSNFEIAWVTNRHAGKARRETIGRLSLKSEHAIQAFGIPNESDKFTDNHGNVYFGLMTVKGEGNNAVVHSLSAEQVYQLALVDEAMAHAMKSVADTARNLQTVPVSDSAMSALGAAA